MAKSLADLSDSELLAVLNQAIAAMAADPAAYSATAGDITALDNAKDNFNADVMARIATEAADRAAVQAKKASRAIALAALRTRRDVAKAGGATSSDMAATGLPSGGDLAPPTATVPLGAVDTSKRLQHTLSWTDAETPGNKRRPRGTMGCEIFVKIGGPPPGDAKECTYLATDSSTPYVVIYEAADVGQMAHYLLRWRMRDGSTSAWGETVSATITG